MMSDSGKISKAAFNTNPNITREESPEVLLYSENKKHNIGNDDIYTIDFLQSQKSIQVANADI